jgi:hypothetical protein
MSDEKQDVQEMADGVELSDDELEGVAGVEIYRDAGGAHTGAAFYVLDEDGNLLVTRPTLKSAIHWADNLQESTRVLTPGEFKKMREGQQGQQ